MMTIIPLTGGLCEEHIDPFGYNVGAKLTPGREFIANTGDIFLTVMGWLSHTEDSHSQLIMEVMIL